MIACNTSTAIALADLRRRHDAADPRRDPARRRDGRPGDPRSGGSASSPPGDGPLARLLPGDQGGEPGDRGLRARHAGARAAGRGRPAARPGGRRDRPRTRWPALLGERRLDGTSVEPAAGVGRDRHAPPRLHALPADRAGDPGRRRRADRRRRLGHGDRRRPWSTCWRSTASRHPARAEERRPTRVAGHDRPATAAGVPSPADDGRSIVPSWPAVRRGFVDVETIDLRESPSDDPPAQRPRRPPLAGRLPRRLGARCGGRPCVGRRAERSARRGLVDWTAASSRVAIGRLRQAPGTPVGRPSCAATEAAYAAAMAVVVPRLCEALGTELPGVVDRVGRRRPGRLGPGERGQLRAT